MFTILSGVCDMPLARCCTVQATASFLLAKKPWVLNRLEVFDAPLDQPGNVGVKADEWLLQQDAQGLIDPTVPLTCAHQNTQVREWPTAHLFCHDCQGVV